MTIHSSILAWKIPRTEKPGRLRSIGLQRIRHDRRDLACTHTHAHTYTHRIGTLFCNTFREKGLLLQISHSNSSPFASDLSRVRQRPGLHSMGPEKKSPGKDFLLCLKIKEMFKEKLLFIYLFFCLWM